MTTRADETGVECPGEESLRLFLAEQIGASRAADVEAHVGVCQACQGVLERLVGGLSQTVDPAPGAFAEEEDGPPVLPGHEPIARIDAGGMGVVWRMRDLTFDRPLAVKVMRARHRDNPELIERFFREARLSGQLAHPSIVPVHAMGVLGDGRAYYTMKLVEGRTLAELLAQSTRDPRRSGLVPMFAQVCQAVAFAHSQGVIHRDLKPANVMLGAHGEVQVMDWGLAKSLGEAPPAAVVEVSGSASTVVEEGSKREGTRAGVVMGTYAYMPPEQARGRVDEVDRRSDVFGLGAILCQLLTGEPPYTGADVRRQAEDADLQRALARLRASGAEAELIRLAGCCLAPAKADRPADAGKVAAALEAYLASVQERLQQDRLERERQQVQAHEDRKRRRVQVRLGSVVVGLVLLLAGGGLYLQRLAADRRQAEARRNEGVESSLEKVSELRRKDRWAEARTLLEQTRDGLGKDDASQLRWRVEQALVDAVLVGELDAIRLKKASQVEGKFQYSRADREYEEVFRRRELADLGEDPSVVAARIRSSPVKEQLVAALDDWATTARQPERRDWVLEVARRADPHPWRDRLREPAVRKDVKRMRALAAEAKVEELSPQAALALANALPPEQGAKLLAEVQRRHPSDFWVTFTLGRVLWDGTPGEAAGYMRAALALRPEVSAVHILLGADLYRQEKVDEAIACFTKALELDGRSAAAHCHLGIALYSKGRSDEAIACYRQALVFNERDPTALNFLGLALLGEGKVDEAISCYRKAIARDPRYDFAYLNLAHALESKGCYGEARDAYALAQRWLPSDDPQYATASRGLETCQRLLRLEPRLQRYLDGTAKPANAREQLDLALICQHRHCYAAAARFYAEAFAQEPALANDLNNLNRYNAGCTAAWAAAGQGEGADKLEEKDRQRLRRQAVTWLRADLALLTKFAREDDPRERRQIAAMLAQWQKDKALAGLRDPAAAKLLAQEQEAYRRLWSDVENLLRELSHPRSASVK